MAGVILSGLLVAAVGLFANLGRSRQTLLDADVAADLAVSLMEEIKQQAYADPTQSGFGPEPGEAGLTRALFDDVDDYHNWTETPPQDRLGNALPRGAGLTRSVQVRYVAANDFTKTAAADEGFKEVQIAVRRGGPTLARQTYVVADVPPAQR